MNVQDRHPLHRGGRGRGSRALSRVVLPPDADLSVHRLAHASDAAVSGYVESWQLLIGDMSEACSGTDCLGLVLAAIARRPGCSALGDQKALTPAGRLSFTCTDEVFSAESHDSRMAVDLVVIELRHLAGLPAA